MESVTVREDRLCGVLLGTALGDALGLPAERMSARAIRKRWGTVDRFHLCGRTGFVSDDTEQAALVAEALARHPNDPEAAVRAFQRALVSWFLRLPFGVGLATIRACTRALLGVSPSGVPSAGNGAAMRSAVVGVFFASDAVRRRSFGEALARVTHRDDRAVEGALYAAEMAAVCSQASPDADRLSLVSRAAGVLGVPGLQEAVTRAAELAPAAGAEEAARVLGTSGYVLHTVGLATYGFLRWGDRPLTALSELIGLGGDTDSTAAVLGAWLGALHGAAGLPGELLERIHPGPFGPGHLRALGTALACGTAPPRYSPVAALGRNLALYPVILGHGLRRLAPF